MERLIQKQEEASFDSNSENEANILLDFDEHQVPPNLEICEYYEVKFKFKNSGIDIFREIGLYKIGVEEHPLFNVG